jgi:SDR family mycofactocin-dependent oxidoreductase
MSAAGNGRVEGKVAFVTGAARGQGRSHAVRLAEEGADIIAIDLCAPTDTIVYPGATPEDLAETVRLVEALGRRIVARHADVRDLAALESVLRDGVAELGHLDIVLPNAGIATFGTAVDLTEAQWGEMIDINLTGVWLTCKASIPYLIESGRGSSIVITSSMAGLKGYGNVSHYSAAKHGVVGLARSLAIELAPHWIRVNCVNPTTVDSPMVMNDPLYKLFAPELEHATREDFDARSRQMQLLDIPWVESIDVSNAILWLVSDEARYITGLMLPVDGGALTGGLSTTGFEKD